VGILFKIRLTRFVAKAALFLASNANTISEASYLKEGRGRLGVDLGTDKGNLDYFAEYAIAPSGVVCI
jgi:hypothetical protein